MKKITIMALMAIMAVGASAQNPDALKSIKKAKTIAEVQSLIQSSESSMSAAENAQAYNKVVDLAMKNVNDAITAIQTNEVQKQMGQEPKENVDMNAFYADLKTAFDAAQQSYTYDQQPNDKGKIAPKFSKANADRLYNLRVYLINGGQEASTVEDNKKAFEYYSTYVDTGKNPLFAAKNEEAAKANANGVADEYISEVARVAAVTAMNNGDIPTALRYTDIVMEDKDNFKDGLNLKIYLMDRGAKTHQDSLNNVVELEKLYEKYPQDNEVFGVLAQMYANMGQNDKQKALVDARLKSDPNNFTAWALKGQTEMNDQKYDLALESLKRALQCQTEDEGQKALINTYVGYCYNQKATELENYDQQKQQLQEAIPFLETARRLDPERLTSNWAYPLYNCYYHIKGENDAATEELKNMLGL